MKKPRDIGKEGATFWAGGAFAEKVSHEDLEEKMKTFHKKHDEDMNFNCKNCDKPISVHNKDWHAGMCDKCFNKEFFPNNQKQKVQR